MAIDFLTQLEQVRDLNSHRYGDARRHGHSSDPVSNDSAGRKSALRRTREGRKPSTASVASVLGRKVRSMTRVSRQVIPNRHALLTSIHSSVHFPPLTVSGPFFFWAPRPLSSMAPFFLVQPSPNQISAKSKVDVAPPASQPRLTRL